MTPGQGWDLDNEPESRSRHTWQCGHFERGKRARTGTVEGRIASDRHLCMVTLSGGAKEHRFTTTDGLRYRGRDRPGMASFLPAGCERRLELRDVAWRWGAIAIEPSHAPALGALPAFAAPEPFLFGLMQQMNALIELDGGLDETYCSTASLALSDFLLSRARLSQKAETASKRLSPSQVRSTLERIDALIQGPIRISDLSAPLNFSDGHFHRAFKGSTGKTPLQVICERRVEHAAILLSQTARPVSEIAFDVGFISQSHLSRMFRSVFRTTPSGYRREFSALEKSKGQDQASWSETSGAGDAGDA